MKRVLCRAAVDQKGAKRFLVTVTGAGDHEGQVIAYNIDAPTEDEAARMGIDRFVREMENEN